MWRSIVGSLIPNEMEESSCKLFDCQKKFRFFATLTSRNNTTPTLVHIDPGHGHFEALILIIKNHGEV